MALTHEDLQAIAGLLETKLEEKLETKLEEKLETKLEEKLKPIQADVADMKSDIAKLETQVLDIQLTLENETNAGIKIIGEGHAILNRRLDEALKVTSEQELLLLRVGHLENEMRRVKDKLQTA